MEISRREFEEELNWQLSKLEVGKEDNTSASLRHREQLIKRLRQYHLDAYTQGIQFVNELEKLYRRGVLSATSPRSQQWILDNGCGSGGVVSALADFGYRVCGVDIDADALALAQRRPAQSPHKRTFLRGDSLTLPFREASFDVILCKSVLEHVPDKMRYLQEVYRALRSGGVFFASFIPNAWWIIECHSQLPIYQCISGREQAIERHFGVQPWGLICPPNFFQLRHLLQAFEWNFRIIPQGGVKIGPQVFRKVVAKALQLNPLWQLLCPGWAVLARKCDDE